MGSKRGRKLVHVRPDCQEVFANGRNHAWNTQGYRGPTALEHDQPGGDSPAFLARVKDWSKGEIEAVPGRDRNSTNLKVIERNYADMRARCVFGPLGPMWPGLAASAPRVKMGFVRANMKFSRRFWEKSRRRPDKRYAQAFLRQGCL